MQTVFPFCVLPFHPTIFDFQNSYKYTEFHSSSLSKCPGDNVELKNKKQTNEQKNPPFSRVTGAGGTLCQTPRTAWQFIFQGEGETSALRVECKDKNSGGNGLITDKPIGF